MLFSIGIEIRPKTADIIISKFPILIIFAVSASLSIANLNTASQIFNVNNGIKTEHSVYNKSTIPYSVVVNTLVYSGIKKNEINLVAKLPIANIAVFFIKFYVLFF